MSQLAACLRHLGQHSWRGVIAVLLAVPLVFTTSGAMAQEYDRDDWEYEPGEGLHQQEWYDPSDWFDREDGIDYEYDYYGDYYEDDYYENNLFDDDYYADDYDDDYYDNYYTSDWYDAEPDFDNWYWDW